MLQRKQYYHNNNGIRQDILYQPYFHNQKYHWSTPSKHDRRFKELNGVNRSKTVPFGAIWSILEYCYDPTFGVLQHHPFSAICDFYQRQCVYMVCSYILVWFEFFMYFGGALLRQLKTCPFQTFSINSWILSFWVVLSFCGGET